MRVTASANARDIRTLQRRQASLTRSIADSTSTVAARCPSAARTAGRRSPGRASAALCAIRRRAVVHVDAARLRSAASPRPSTAPARPRQQLDDADAIRSICRAAARRRHVLEHRQQLVDRQRRRCRRRTASPRALRARDRRRRRAPARVTSRASARCASRCSGALAASRRSSSSICVAIEKGEELQVAARRRDRRCSARTDRTRNGDVRAGSSHTVPASVLPNFVPAAVVSSGITRPCAFVAAQLANQIDAGGDVAPLIAAAHLQRAAVAIVQLRESRRPAAAGS